MNVQMVFSRHILVTSQFDDDMAFIRWFKVKHSQIAWLFRKRKKDSKKSLTWWLGFWSDVFSENHESLNLVIFALKELVTTYRFKHQAHKMVKM